MHAGSGAFVVANVFAAGSARIVAGLGFETVAILSGSFGDAPEAVAETECGTAQACLVERKIKDAAKNKDKPIYPFDAALERISAVVEAARSLNFDIKLTRHCENFMGGKPVQPC